MEHANLEEKNPYDWPLVRKDPPALIGQKCLDCGKVNFPPTPACTTCLGTKMQAFPFGEKGTLYSYTIVRVPMPGFEAPYAIGYIDLQEGFRLFSYIPDWQSGDLKTGAEMELVVTRSRTDRQGNRVLGFAYRPRKR